MTQRKYNKFRDRVLKTLGASVEKRQSTAFLVQHCATPKAACEAYVALLRMQRNGDIETHGEIGHVRVVRLKEKKS